MIASNQDVEAGGYGRLESDLHPDDPIDENTHLRLDELEEADSSPPTPRFLQDEGTWRRLKWVPTTLRRWTKSAVHWAKGPSVPRIHTIQPICPSIQEAPLRLLDSFLPKQKDRLILLLAFYACWILTFGLMLWASTLTSDVAGLGKPSNIGCGSTFWVPGNDCGLNGNGCRPFNGTSFAFRCPADCADVMVLEPRAVGDQEVLYQTLVIGGPAEDNPNGAAVYRGDSFICSSAIHAGVISDASGGCGVVSLTGMQSLFASTLRNGISSIGFDSYFPQSFTFKSSVSCDAKDLRWPFLGVSLFFSIIFSLFTTSPSLFYFTTFTALFAHTGLVSDPPGHDKMASLFSNIIGRFLPAIFCGFVMYRYMGVRRTLTGLTAQIEKTVLWLGACWVGTLSNYTFRFIPIQRLNAHDIEQQPGAVLALAIIMVLLVAVVVQQVFYFQQEGRLPKYLGLYGILLLSILISLSFPGLNLRIHHYILALLLLPGTSMQTRTSLIYQGLLVGLFINGIARWGFDPVLQTPAALQGDAQYHSDLPDLFGPIIYTGAQVSNITFRWHTPPPPFDGVSVLVNDVERFRGYKTDEGWRSGAQAGTEFMWHRKSKDVQKEYFRFAYLEGTTTYDYTKAGIWDIDGSWEPMEPGPSRIRGREADVELVSMS